MRIEISDFVMRTFVPRKKALNADAQSSNSNKNHEVTTAKSCFFGFCLLPSRLYCRYRNLTGSCAAALADFTADRELHPALKTSFDSFVMFYCYSCYYFKAELSRGKFFCAAGVSYIQQSARMRNSQSVIDTADKSVDSSIALEVSTLSAFMFFAMIKQETVVGDPDIIRMAII